MKFKHEVWIKLKNKNKMENNLTEKEEKYLDNCLESLSKFSKEDLLNEIEQLLLSKTDKGETLKHLKEFYSQGGLRQSK